MSHVKQRDRLVKNLPPMSAIIRGALVREHHENCPCHPRGRYGPYWRLSVNQGGRTVMRQLQKHQVPLVREALANYHRWWKTALKIMVINTELLLSKED